MCHSRHYRASFNALATVVSGLRAEMLQVSSIELELLAVTVLTLV